MNKKVKNATETTFNNVKYKSKLEARIAEELLNNGIDGIYEKTKFTLQDKFKFEGKTYRAITYTPDFVIQEDYRRIYLEIKGFETEVWKIKKKLFLKYMMEHLPNDVFYEIHNMKELKEVIEQIKNGRKKIQLRLL